MNDNRNLMPSILDREISTGAADAFGHIHFTKALQSIVESPGNKPPFSVGLLGKWGTGKSSIKALYLTSLQDDRTKDRKGRTRADRFHAITFNAWRFGGENIKRALLRHVFLALEGDEVELKDALFRQVRRPAQEKRAWREIWQDAFEKWGWSLLQVVAVYLVLFVALFLIAWIFQISDERVIGLMGALFAITGVPIVKYLLDPKRFNVPLYRDITRIELPRTSSEEYEDLLIEQLKKYKSGATISKKGKSCERLIVFVDDLDRLSAEEMISGLDAIRTFMEIPEEQVPGELGLVFVVSADETRIAYALASRHMQSDHLPGAIFSHNDARRYLDRIFQFRVEIPQFPKRDMRDYAMQRLRDDAPAVFKELTEVDPEIRTGS